MKRIVACTLVALQIWIGLPVEATAAAVEVLQRPAARSAVIANRTVPAVTPVPAYPVFSNTPTNDEIFHARVFEEPLVPMTGEMSVPENRALAAAINTYLRSGNTEDLSLFEKFLLQYPDSAWRASLLTDMGIAYRRTGYFTKALNAWRTAWELSENEAGPLQRAIGDRAVGELAELNARLGRYEILETLFEHIGSRDVGGPAAQKLRGAKEGLWLMENRPQDAFRCGPMALDRILAFERGTAYQRDERIVKSESTNKGMSLPQVLALGNDLGMNLQMAKRSGDANIPLPAVVHWNVNHYAAIVKQEGSKFLIQDPDVWGRILG